MLRKYFAEAVKDAILKAVEHNEAGELTKETMPVIRAEIPKNADFGDFAVNISSLSRYTKTSPKETAERVVKYIENGDFEVNVTGGFINFKVGKTFLTLIVKEILEKKTQYGASELGNGEKIILEYVSANPTGPFHIGHGRWAAVGSTLANILKFTGHDVYQEFYVNDAGNQIKNLGRSLYIRVKQQQGIDVDFPRDEAEAKKFYVGEYLVDCAKDFCAQRPERAAAIAKTDEVSESDLNELSLFAKLQMLDKQKALLEKFNTNFDNFYLETTLHERGDVQKCLDALEKSGMLYEKDGAIWFKSSKYGDDEDRVIKKTDGAYTYLTADIAYHYDKLKRGFTKLINIWGADHHGYIPRMKAAIEALGFNPDCLTVLLGQLVNLCIKGEQVRMGKRTKMITLDELIDDVGVDATRFWMIMRNIDTTLEFDVELAKSQTDENPVFYVQYAHARGCSVLRNAVNPRFDTVNKKEIAPMFTKEELENLENADVEKIFTHDEEFSAIKMLILKLEEYKTVTEQASTSFAPYLLTKYLRELAAVFHKFYTVCRILGNDKEESFAKLTLIKSTQHVLESGLKLAAISAPERM